MTALLWTAKHWKEIAIGVAVVALVALGVYFRGVMAERDAAIVAQRQLMGQVEAVTAAHLKALEQQEEIANAIRKVQVRSINNITMLEREPAPVFRNSTAHLVLIPGGLLQAGYSSASQ